MVKVCSICQVSKHLEEFYSNGKTPKGTQKYKPYCKPCEIKKRMKDHYDKIIGILSESNRLFACESCGYAKNSSALDFHHNSEEKNFSISQMKNSPKDKIRAEIALCTILCSNCHRELHSTFNCFDEPLA